MCLDSGHGGIKPGAGGCSHASRDVERGQSPGEQKTGSGEKGAGVGSLTFQKTETDGKSGGNGWLDLDTVSN